MGKMNRRPLKLLGAEPLTDDKIREYRALPRPSAAELAYKGLVLTRQVTLEGILNKMMRPRLDGGGAARHRES